MESQRPFRWPFVAVLTVLVQVGLWFLFSFGDALAQTAQPTAAQISSKNILLLHSYGHGGKGVAQFDEGLVNTLNHGGINTNQLYFEHLDLERNRSDPKYLTHLRDELRHKYAAHKIDAILTVQQPALAWLLTEGAQIAPQAPVVTIQAQAPNPAEAGSRRFVSIFAEFDVTGTLNLALKLFPRTTQVMLVAGDSKADIRLAQKTELSLASLNKSLVVESTVGMPFDRMIERISTLSEQTIILFLQYNRDSVGLVMASYEVEKEVAGRANVPVFGLFDLNLFNGGIGGSLISVKGLGEKAGTTLLDLISGKMRLTEPVTISEVTAVPMLNWEEIKRWNGDRSALPSDTVYFNRTLTLWEQYSFYIAGLAIFVFAESALIVALLYSRRRNRLAERSLREGERKLRMISSSSQDAILMIDHEGKTIFWNLAAEAMFGYSEEEALGSNLHALLAPSKFHEQFRTSFQRFQNTGEGGAIGKTVRLTALRRNGEEFPVELSISAVRAGERWNAVGVVRDISTQAHNEERLRHLSLTVEQSPASIVITSLDATIEYVNNAFVAISGYSREEAIGQNSRILQSGRTPPETYQSLWETLTQGRTWTGELYNRHRDGTEYIELATITPLRNEDGTIVKYVAVKEDITARKSAEADALHLAFFDQLTNLPNRRLLLDRLEKAILSSARSNRPGALIYIDLDNFKSLNDTLGHDVGDQLLRQVGIRLVSCVRASDTVARFGGDEFVVMIEDLEETIDASIAQAAVVGNKILQSMNESFQLDNHTHNNSASVGIAMFTGQEGGSAELLKQADIAMYSAKESGRNAVRFFDTRMQERVVAQAAIEADLRQALVSNQFQLHYQPKMDSDGHIAGAEALVRLNHPLNGIIAPDNFVPIAEKSGLILQIGDWVLNDACAQLARWSSDPKLARMTLAVNVSARQFSEPGFVQSVLVALERSGANPKRLVLELTESMLVGTYEPIVNKMATLRAHGIRFALDDFGTGYSSLAYLNRLSLDQLKIDKSFVNGVPNDPNSCAIVRTIIALGKALNLRVIAEGVETRAQLDFLKDGGCNLYQGYFFGRPLTLEAFNSLVDISVVSNINAGFQSEDGASAA